jgi:CHASE3 domain sensor protein
MTRLMRFRLSDLPLARKLALGFGAILLLTAAIVAYGQISYVHLEHEYATVAQKDVDKLVLGGAAKAALTDLHFAQTANVVARGQSADDYNADLKVLNSDLLTLRAMSNDNDDLGNLRNVEAALHTFELTNVDLFNALSVQDMGAARKIVAGPADKAADAVMEAIEDYIADAKKDRAEAAASYAATERDA